MTRNPPRLVFWETTSRCNLKCVHCRRTNVPERGDELTELSTKEAVEILESLAALPGGNPHPAAGSRASFLPAGSRRLRGRAPRRHAPGRGELRGIPQLAYGETRKIPNPKSQTLEIRATCAPHQTRIVRQKVAASSPEFSGRAAQMRGCLAGSAIAFISHKGEVFPCGYLPVTAGDLKEHDFWKIWEDSEVFRTISDPAALKGKCGVCEFKVICGGCRARAFGVTGDYMGQEPYCLYEPKVRIKD